MSAEEEIDYMSEEFLTSCIGNNDIRPGLTQSHSLKRKIEIERNKKERDEINRKKMRPIKEIQEEIRKEGLSKALDSSNKGFAMMAKMGFIPGTCLGKGGGITEPITVEVKPNRVGLGWQQLIKEKRERMRKARAEKNKEFDPLEYRARIINEHNEKLIKVDLKKSRKVCYDLDCKEGTLDPAEYWFWPEYTWDNDDDDEVDEQVNEVGDTEESDPNSRLHSQAEEENLTMSNLTDDSEELFEPTEQLQILTSYLRTTYIYCSWCCTAYEDVADLESNCPGSTRSDHD